LGEITDTRTNWLDNDQLEQVRGQVPLVYVDAVPVRVNELGVVTHVGMLLRQAPDGSISRTVVSGRVLLNERIRDALLRHLEKDLGPMALPKIPPEPAPFTIVEYFTDPNISGFHDPRHHAVSLAFVFLFLVTVNHHNRHSTLAGTHLSRRSVQKCDSR